jgi:hypothetical protein
MAKRVLVQRARRFWAWFLEQELELFEEAAGPLGELRARVRRVQGNVGAEIERLEGGRKRLLLTANGVREALAVVELLDREAPALRLFELRTFRRALPALEPVRLGEFVLRPEQVEFALDGDGLTLYMEGFDARDGDRALSYKAAAMRMLDAALGEVRVATEVGFIEFRGSGAEIGRARLPLWRLSEEFASGRR